MRYNQWLLPLLITLTLNACANYKLHFDKEEKNWAATPLPDKKLAHRLYLIGDAGGAEYGKSLPAIDLLKERLDQEKKEKKVTVVYLGDNIYWNGLPPETTDETKEERELDEHKLRVQLDPIKDFKGKVFFVAGNHDWYGYGLEGLKAQKDFIEDYLDEDDVLMPEPGCGDPEEIELNDNLILILLDSQWWLENWSKTPEMNEGCDIKDRAAFSLEMTDILKGERNKNVIVALHHPLMTYGPHGGGFTWKDHIFPLTNVKKNLWIPLPIIGSIYPLFRSTIGTKQDLSHPAYQALQSTLVNTALNYGEFIFVSGHEHTLQYIERRRQKFIVSGSGSKSAPTRLGDGAKFASSANGFAQLDVYKDGSIWVQYWGIEDGEGKILYRTQVKGPLESLNQKPDTSQFADSFEPITTRISDRDYSKKGLGKKIWGKHYRQTYAEEIEVKQLNLDTFAGGVKPVKRGGGNQTRSLRLENEQGQQYTMRSVKKDASRTLPYPFTETFVKDIVVDNFSAAHPLATLVVPPMADAIGVYHTNPEIYYVPKQAGLDTYNDDYANELYLVEERPDDDVWQEKASFGKPDEIVSTSKAVEETLEEHDHVINTRLVVRNRLFDNILGDWDRHDDQWRWSVWDDDDMNLYTPIPRDRDQVFSRYDGWFIDLFRSYAPAFQPLRAYDSKLKAVKWSNYGARHFDPTFTNAADWEMWKVEALHIKKNLTDEVIDKAFEEKWPKNLVELDGPFIKKHLKARRDNIVDIARRFYEHLAKEVDVIGTFERERIIINRNENNTTTVEMFHLSDDTEPVSFYKRTFLPEETKEIRIFGLSDDDEYVVQGRSNKGPKVRLLGGRGNDTYSDVSRVGGGKKTIIYDYKDEENQYDKGAETKLMRSNDPLDNAYIRKEPHHELDYSFGLPILGLNPDDGIFLGGLFQWTTYGFKKAPYGSQQTISALYAAGTNGVKLNYSGEYIDILGEADVRLDAEIKTPLYTDNFYGLGNNTINREEELGQDYHRIKQREISLYPAIMSRQYNSSLSIGPEFEAIRVEETPGRIIAELSDQFDPNIFRGMEFLGLRFNYNYENTDNVAYPSRGVGLTIDGGWKMMMDNASRNFPYLEGAISFYQRIDREGVLVFATRIGGKQIFNNKFEFFQAATLGGTGDMANIRGFRRDRFAGQSSFFHNTDLRLQVFVSRNRAVPFVAGIYGGFDYGRVWLEGENTSNWHIGYGGGIFISPFNQATFTLGLFRGDDEPLRVTVGGGFFF